MINSVIRTNQPIDWDNNKNVTVLLRYKMNNTIHMSKIKLTNIYKLGVYYEPVYYKNGTIRNVKAIGYIIDKEYQKIENLQFPYIKKLRTKIRQYGSMMIIKEEEYKVINSQGKEITRKNKEYLCKWNKNDKFETVTKEVVKRRTNRNKK